MLKHIVLAAFLTCGAAAALCAAATGDESARLGNDIGFERWRRRPPPIPAS